MRLLSILVLNVFLLTALASCGSIPSADSGSAAISTPTSVTLAQSTPTTVTQTQAVTETENVTSASAGTAPQIFLPEDLLTDEEASWMVGRTVTITSVSDEITETGEIYADYTYDFPSGSTVFASLYITQNALVSEAELKKGHDAKWSFEDSNKYVEDEVVSIPNLGNEAFYLKNNMEVSVLYKDFYILVVFVMDNDDAATLALNKTIAAHIIDELS